MIEGLLAIALATAVPLGVRHAGRSVGSGPGGSSGRAVIVAIAAAVVAIAAPRGMIAAGLAVPWLVATVAGGAIALLAVARRARVDRSVTAVDVGIVAAFGFLAVGAAALVLDRAAIRPFGFATTIVLLTAVHFHVAGFVLTLAGALVARARPTAGSRLALGALLVGTPLTALGFFGFPLATWVGALLVATGGLSIGLGQILVGRAGGRSGGIGRLVAVGGAALFVTMPLAAGYATGTTFGIPFLDIPAMAAVHGTLNVVGFAIPSMVGWGGIGR